MVVFISIIVILFIGVLNSVIMCLFCVNRFGIFCVVRGFIEKSLFGIYSILVSVFLIGM